MREFEWLLGDDVVAAGRVEDDGSVRVTVIGLAPIGFFSVADMQAQFDALPLSFELRWVG